MQTPQPTLRAAADPPSPAMVARLLLQEEVRQRILAHFQRRPPATTALVLFAVAVHLLVGVYDWSTGQTDFYGVFLGARSASGLTALGANVWSLVAQGQYWRLLSCIFLHADAFHLGLNMLALFGLGRLCEAVFGPARFVLMFLLSGLAGSLLSLVGNISHTGVPGTAQMSVGASGAVFGLMGAGVVFGRRFRRVLPTPVRRIFTRGLMPWILLNLFIGMTVRQIDNLGHVGGLIAGVVVAILVGSPVIPGREGTSRGTLVAVFVSALLLGWAGAGTLGYCLLPIEE